MKKKQQNYPVFILIEPQMGENIGATARAMMNCGLSELRLVNPRDGWPNEKANAMSSGALDLMPPVQVFDNVKDAIADCHHIYATAADIRDMVKPTMNAKFATQRMIEKINDGQKIVILFGRERSGLTNEEISLCHDHISIPLNPEFNSLNLGQAALIIGYEFYQATDNRPEKNLDFGKSFPTTAKDFDDMCLRLENELSESGFFRVAEMKEHMVRNIRNFLSRGTPSDQEIKTFHGVITALIGKKNK